MIQITRLLVRKKDISKTDIMTTSVDNQPGTVVLKIDSFALTTNNITYAAFGDVMGYWLFFPTGNKDQGSLPVWGFADVVQSDLDGITVGERFYGFFPLASHVVMQPDHITQTGFFDALPHRRNLPAVYNQYTRCSHDAGYDPALEDIQSLLRPLFITSYVLADFLLDNSLFGAKQTLLSSASSKTAYGTAHALKQIAPQTPVVGMTSVRNRGFVQGLGCYDSVVTYKELETMAQEPTTYVDFSGSALLRKNIHAHFGNNLNYDCVVGSAQTASPFRAHAKLSPKPTFFFAPTQIAKRNKEIGRKEQTRRMLEAQNQFFAHVGSQTPPWLTVVKHQGFEQAQTLLTQLHKGEIGPETGNIVRL